MGEREKSLSTRIFSGVIGAILTITILIFNQNCLWLINLITAIISVLAMKEIFSVIEISKNYFITIPSMIFASILPITGFSFVWGFFWYLYTIIIFVNLLLNKTLKIDKIFTIYSMSLIISFCLFKIVDLRDYGKEFGSFYVFLALMIAWMTDTGAYFCGILLGKNKLCPEISPKKTIEGFIGGIIVCLISVILIFLIFNYFMFSEKQEINYFLIIILSLTGSLVSSFGDLCFSAIKRSYHVKDFGNIMPGHGGVLDRFDSVIFVVPYVYFFVKFIHIIN